MHRWAVVEHDLLPADPDPRHRHLTGHRAGGMLLVCQLLEVRKDLAVERQRVLRLALEHQERGCFHQDVSLPRG
jgi:hypothetical protein